MSKLGYIYDSYGKQFNIAIANTYSYNILNGNNLPTNTIIIASDIDENNKDTGSYSLIVTDNDGNPVRLTYTIKQGNGLYYNTDKDYIEFKIDNDTIINSDNGLKFNIRNHLSNDFTYINWNNISINENNIPTASKNTLGISAVDGKTILSDNGVLSVNTSKLIYANNVTEQYGIVIGDNNSIFIDNGIIKLNVSSLNKSNENQFGIVIPDNQTVVSNNGILSVVTENLDMASENNYGISKPDNDTIVLEDNRLTVKEEHLPIATDFSYGISKIDINTININENNMISMKDYDYIMSSIDKFRELSIKYNNQINDFNTQLSDGTFLLRKQDIILFSITETSVTELEKPKKDEEVINMPLQFTSASFDVITTCDFILSIIFDEGTNEFPNIDVVEVNYNDERIYSKEEALNPLTVYPSTEGELKRISVKFSAKNFRNSVKEYSLVTSVRIVISDNIDHNKIKAEKYSIIRYNSIYDESYRRKDDSKESFYILVENSVKWALSEKNK